MVMILLASICFCQQLRILRKLLRLVLKKTITQLVTSLEEFFYRVWLCIAQCFIVVCLAL